MEWAVWRKSSHSIRACLGAAPLYATGDANGNITAVAPAPMPGSGPGTPVTGPAKLTPDDRAALLAFQTWYDHDPDQAGKRLATAIQMLPQ